jgi:hypothetical protein
MADDFPTGDFHIYETLRDAGASAVEACIRARGGGMDGDRQARMLQAVFGLSRVDANLTVMRAEGMSEELDDYDRSLLPDSDDGRAAFQFELPHVMAGTAVLAVLLAMIHYRFWIGVGAWQLCFGAWLTHVSLKVHGRSLAGWVGSGLLTALALALVMYAPCFLLADYVEDAIRYDRFVDGLGITLAAPICLAYLVLAALLDTPNELTLAVLLCLASIASVAGATWMARRYESMAVAYVLGGISLANVLALRLIFSFGVLA